MEFSQKKFREIDLFDFTTFFWPGTILNFLAYCAARLSFPLLSLSQKFSTYLKNCRTAATIGAMKTQGLILGPRSGFAVILVLFCRSTRHICWLCGR